MSDDNEIKVGITADASGLQSEAEKAVGAANQAGDAMQQAMETMASKTAESAAQVESSFAKMHEAVAASVEGMVERISEGGTQIKERVEGIAEAIAGVQKTFALLAEGAVAGFIGEQILDLGKEFAEFSEQTEIAGQKSGMTAEEIQKLDFAAKMSGVSAQQMQEGMVRLSRAMLNAEQGSKQAENAFKSFGLSADELKNMSLDEVLSSVADRFSEWQDGAEKTALATQLFGRAGADLIPVLNKGSSGLEELKQRAEELGVVLSGEDIEAGAKLAEKFKEIGAQASTLKLRIGDSVLAKMVDTAVQGAEKWIAQELAKTAATEAGTAVRATATATGAAAGMAAESAAGKESAMNSAYRAAAAVYADVAEIPYVGWLLAPPAAAAAFAAVEAFGGSISSAAGGYYNVPDNMLANIHKDEMVLPSWAAKGVRSIIETGQGAPAGGSAGGVSVTYAPQIGGVLGDSQFKGMLEQHSDTIYDAVKQAVRDARR